MILLYRKTTQFCMVLPFANIIIDVSALFMTQLNSVKQLYIQKTMISSRVALCFHTWSGQFRRHSSLTNCCTCSAPRVPIWNCYHVCYVFSSQKNGRKTGWLKLQITFSVYTRLFVRRQTAYNYISSKNNKQIALKACNARNIVSATFELPRTTQHDVVSHDSYVMYCIICPLTRQTYSGQHPSPPLFLVFRRIDSSNNFKGRN